MRPRETPGRTRDLLCPAAWAHASLASGAPCMSKKRDRAPLSTEIRPPESELDLHASGCWTSGLEVSALAQIRGCRSRRRTCDRPDALRPLPHRPNVLILMVGG